MTEVNARIRDLIGFTFLYAQLAATFWLVPDWSPTHFGEPVYMAAVANVIVAVAITAIRLSDRRGAPAERFLLALFLGGMPLIYLWSWVLSPQPGWLVPELIGVALFVPAAVLGWRRSIWLLAIGIAAHGVFWDLWHYDRTAFIPNWYVLGCLITDVCLGVYVALQVPAFARASHSASWSTRVRAASQGITR